MSQSATSSGGRVSSAGDPVVQPPSTDGVPSDTKRCPVCGEAIWAGAGKCTHCNTDFTWRRYLTLSNTTLALITALIAVIAASAPAFRLMVTPDNSELTGVFAGISTSGETISMLFSNSGRRTGAINRIWVTVTYPKSPEIRSFSIYPHTKDDGAIFVGPGKTLGTQFLFANSRMHWQPKIAEKEDFSSLGSDFGWTLWGDTDCKVWVKGVNADGSPFNSKLDMGCQNGAFQMFRKLLEDASPAKK